MYSKSWSRLKNKKGPTLNMRKYCPEVSWKCITPWLFSNHCILRTLQSFKRTTHSRTRVWAVRGVRYYLLVSKTTTHTCLVQQMHQLCQRVRSISWQNRRKLLPRIKRAKSFLLKRCISWVNDIVTDARCPKANSEWRTHKALWSPVCSLPVSNIQN